LQIDEVSYDGSDAEYIALINVGGLYLPLHGWLLGDAERPGDGEGIYALPDIVLGPGALFVVARQGSAFQTRFGRKPDAALEAAGGAIPQLARRTDLAKGKLALDDGGDEVLLLDPDLRLADAVAFGKGDYAGRALPAAIRCSACPRRSFLRWPTCASGFSPDRRAPSRRAACHSPWGPRRLRCPAG
jgi:hypothetical protein